MSQTELLGWLIFLLPLGSFVLIALVIRLWPILSGWLTVLAIGGSFLLAGTTFFNILAAPGHTLPTQDYEWVALPGLTLRLGITLDSLTAFMLLVVTSVSLLVQVYSIAYMRGDRGYSRYFAFMSLFTASMLGLVLADNLIMLYVFWELVGLCSYLLIGHWFHRPEAARAATKAFVVTRLGDFGLLAAILILMANTNVMDIAQLHELARSGALGGSLLSVVALGVFSGAVGKSAQFPLHVWLPDAMEGPTPVSALIHAATMVAAGVYLVARLFPVFTASPEAMTVVALVGGFTALFAASMGLVMHDIKRVLAYSTISQLGYMMLGLGMGGYVAGLFHLLNHAFFKALLFLGAGSAHHATGTYDLRYMGGLWRAMPITLITTVVASLSLAGLPPFSGFWSKDEILAETIREAPVLYLMALSTVFLTAFYMFRAIFLTFGGEYRGGAAAERAAAEGHPGGGAASPEAPDHHKLHESPALMTVPLIILGILSVISGALNLPFALGLSPHWLNDFLVQGAVAQTLAHREVSFQLGPAALSTVVALGGMLLAYALYGARWLAPERLTGRIPWLYALVLHKYGFDLLYEELIVRRSFVGALCAALDWFDGTIVDGAVNGSAWLTVTLARWGRLLQSGQVQAYAISIFLGIVVMVAGFMLLR